MRSRAVRWISCAGTSIPAMPTSPSAIASTANTNICPALASACPVLCPAAVRITAICPRSSHHAIAPSTTTLAIALPSSISPCRPKMRPSPFAGLIRLGLNASASQRKPSEPRIAGPPIAATSVRPSSAASGAAIISIRRAAIPAGSNPAMSPRSKLSPRASMCPIAPTNHGPASASQPAPASITSATPSSLGLEDVALRPRLAQALVGRGFGLVLAIGGGGRP